MPFSLAADVSGVNMNGPTPSQHRPPPRGDLCAGEDVKHKGGGAQKADPLPLLSFTTNSSSCVSSWHKVRRNYAIEGLLLRWRIGSAFLPSTSASTNVEVPFRAMSSLSRGGGL